MPIEPASPEADLQTTLQSQARRTAALVTKSRARSFAGQPTALEHICRGLSTASPGEMIDIAKGLLRAERVNPRRWFGFGGEVGALNAQAILLLGRARRRNA